MYQMYQIIFVDDTLSSTMKSTFECELYKQLTYSHKQHPESSDIANIFNSLDEKNIDSTVSCGTKHQYC
jgi:hypothetical protein